jgi:hypothetical protein
MVDLIRHGVERALPWFDVARYREERERQAETIRAAHEVDRTGRAAVEAFHSVARLRR